MKRRLREVVRRRLERLEPGYDCLIVARQAIVAADYVELERALLQLLVRSGVLADDDAKIGDGGSQS